MNWPALALTCLFGAAAWWGFIAADSYLERRAVARREAYLAARYAARRPS